MYLESSKSRILANLKFKVYFIKIFKTAYLKFMPYEAKYVIYICSNVTYIFDT